MLKAEKIVLVMNLRDSIEITTGSSLATSIISFMMFFWFCKD